QLMDRLFAARPLPLPVRDGPRQLLPTRLRRGHFRWRRFELLATLLQPLPVLDQTVPLVLQVREYPLVLLPQRTPARGADPVRPGLPELPELLLQLLRPVPVRLEPRVDLLPPLDPRGALRLELPLRGLELRPQRLQLLAVLLEEPRRLLERREPLRAPRQLPDQRDLGFGKGVAPLREPGELREVLALLGDGGERGQLPAQREELPLRPDDGLQLPGDPGRVPLRGGHLPARQLQGVIQLPGALPGLLDRFPARRDLGQPPVRRSERFLRLPHRAPRLLPPPLRRLPFRRQRLRVRQPGAQPLDLVPQLVAPRPGQVLRHPQPLVAQHLAQE